MEANKQKALDAALAQIERQFGKGTVMRMGDKEAEAIPAISTGSLGLDVALGIGGLPKGRIVEVYGPESSGKTTLTLSVIAQCQKAGGTAAFIDAEHALDPIYAEKLGVNVEDLIILILHWGETGPLGTGGDVDQDGDTDVVIANNSGPVRLLVNDTDPATSDGWLGLRLVDASGCCDVPGARVRVERADGFALWRRARGPIGLPIGDGDAGEGERKQLRAFGAG